MTTEEQLNRLTGIVDALASTVVAHDNQIESLIQVVEQNSEQITATNRQIAETGRQMAETGRQMAETDRRIAALERQWQAYINTLPRQ
jgi:chromosome segregation ATPase